MRAQDSLLYISAPVNALVEGLYREDTTIADILARGDFGIGTFNDLDGEMVVLDGVVYQLRSDGIAYAVTPETRTPFACVTFFHPYSEEEIDQPLDYPGLLALFDRLLPSKNMLYALRLQGLFDYVRTRSVPRQDAYRPLVEVAREQPEFEFERIEGTLVGYWTPNFMQSVAVPGYHLHTRRAEKSGIAGTKFDVHLDHRGLEPSVNRLVLGMLASALFLGSSLMLSQKVPPLLFPKNEFFGLHQLSVLGLSGCIVAILLGLRLLWAIGRSGHLDRKE